MYFKKMYFCLLIILGVFVISLKSMFFEGKELSLREKVEIDSLLKDNLERIKSEYPLVRVKCIEFFLKYAKQGIGYKEARLASLLGINDTSSLVSAKAWHLFDYFLDLCNKVKEKIKRDCLNEDVEVALEAFDRLTYLVEIGYELLFDPKYDFRREEEICTLGLKRKDEEIKYKAKDLLKIIIKKRKLLGINEEISGKKRGFFRKKRAHSANV